MVNLNLTDRVKYELKFGNEILIIPEPEGWKDDSGLEFDRDLEYNGMITNFSNNLVFILDGAEFITSIKETYDIIAQLNLVKSVRNDDTDIFEIIYEGVFDLSTYSIKDGKVKVKLNSSGLTEKIKARESDGFEYQRETTVNGTALQDPAFKIAELNGKRIFLRTGFSQNESTDYANVGIQSNAGNTRNATVGYPLELTRKSHEKAVSVLPNTTGTKNNGSAGMMFFLVSDKDRVLDISFNFDVNLYVDQYENIQWARYEIRLVKYIDDSEYVILPENVITLYNFQDNHPVFGNEYDYSIPDFQQQVNISWEGQIELNEGESLAIEALCEADFFVDNNAGLRVFAQDFVVNEFKVLEDSSFPATTTKCVLAHDLGSRLMNIISDREDTFYSKSLGRTELGYSEDGDSSGIGFAHGFWIRGFSKPIDNSGDEDQDDEDENKFKDFTTSFKDFREFMSMSRGMGFGIEKVGFRERLRMEPRNYFFQNIVTIKLGKVSNVERKVAKEYYFSSIEIGYNKSVDYEEAYGLDEYNSKSEFITNMTRFKNDYTQTSDYRADVHGKEFVRRKPAEQYPFEDTKYDSDIFPMDLKRINSNIYTERLWQDDFDEEPIGVFSPETATNLRFTPLNMLRYHHNDIISATFRKYPEDFVRYTSNPKGNTNLETRLSGFSRYKESGDVLNADFFNPIFVPDWIEFEYEVDSELLKLIQGYTFHNGENIMNYYGLVEFTNEFNQTERGFLFNLKPNDKGKWKLLKSFL